MLILASLKISRKIIALELWNQKYWFVDSFHYIFFTAIVLMSLLKTQFHCRCSSLHISWFNCIPADIKKSQEIFRSHFISQMRHILPQNFPATRPSSSPIQLVSKSHNTKFPEYYIAAKVSNIRLTRRSLGRGRTTIVWLSIFYLSMFVSSYNDFERLLF